MGFNEAGEPERFTVERDGFYGFLHRPERDRFPGKALIVVGGSEGDEAIPLDLGCVFAQEGITTLGLCYWNVPGLPTELVEVPFVPGFEVNKAGIVRRLVTEQQLDMCWLYERALQKAPVDAEIAVENIGGPVLLVCASDDRMWPSATACRAVEERLRVRKHPHAVKRLEYEHASHLIVPLASPLLRAFKVERAHRRECAASRADAFRQTMDFLRAW